MSTRDVLGDFPSTHATWLVTRIDDGGEAALREAALHLMERYRAPLVAYAAQSRIANIDEPDELADDLTPLLDLILSAIPAPSYEEGHPLQALVTLNDVQFVEAARIAEPMQRFEREVAVAFLLLPGGGEAGIVNQAGDAEDADAAHGGEAGDRHLHLHVGGGGDGAAAGRRQKPGRFPNRLRQ